MIEKIKNYFNRLFKYPETDLLILDWKILKKSADNYLARTVPMEGLVLVAGVDVHGNGLTVVTRAFGENLESFLVEECTITGDTLNADVWIQLGIYLNQPFPHESGGESRILLTGINADYRFFEVYKFASKRSRCVPIRMLASDSIAKAYPEEVDFSWVTGKMMGCGDSLPIRWTIKDCDKYDLHKHLRLNPGKPGSYHFPKNTTDEYFKQLCGEALVQKTRYEDGVKMSRTFWVPTYHNHIFNCEVLIRALVRICRLDSLTWDEYKKIICSNSQNKKSGEKVNGEFINC